MLYLSRPASHHYILPLVLMTLILRPALDPGLTLIYLVYMIMKEIELFCGFWMVYRFTWFT